MTTGIPITGKEGKYIPDLSTATQVSSNYKEIYLTWTAPAGVSDSVYFWFQYPTGWDWTYYPNTYITVNSTLTYYYEDVPGTNGRNQLVVLSGVTPGSTVDIYLDFYTSDPISGYELWWNYYTPAYYTDWIAQPNKTETRATAYSYYMLLQQADRSGAGFSKNTTASQADAYIQRTGSAGSIPASANVIQTIMVAAHDTQIGGPATTPDNYLSTEYTPTSGLTATWTLGGAVGYTWSQYSASTTNNDLVNEPLDLVLMPQTFNESYPVAWWSTATWQQGTTIFSGGHNYYYDSKISGANDTVIGTSWSYSLTYPFGVPVKIGFTPNFMVTGGAGTYSTDPNKPTFEFGNCWTVSPSGNTNVLDGFDYTVTYQMPSYRMLLASPQVEPVTGAVLDGDLGDTLRRFR